MNYDLPKGKIIRYMYRLMKLIKRNGNCLLLLLGCCIICQGFVLYQGLSISSFLSSIPLSYLLFLIFVVIHLFTILYIIILSFVKCIHI